MTKPESWISLMEYPAETEIERLDGDDFKLMKGDGNAVWFRNVQLQSADGGPTVFSYRVAVTHLEDGEAVFLERTSSFQWTNVKIIPVFATSIEN